MTPAQVEEVIINLPLGIVKSKEQKVAAAIAAAAQAVSESGLYLQKGGSTQSGKHSTSRLYLQKTLGCSHNYRHEDYQENMVDVWEFTTRSGGYFRSISALAIIRACNSIITACK